MWDSLLLRILFLGTVRLRALLAYVLWGERSILAKRLLLLVHYLVQIGCNFVLVLPQGLPNWIFKELLPLHRSLRHQSRVADDTTVGSPADCLLVVGKVDRVVAPEVLLGIHLLDDVVHCLEHVVTEGPNAHRTLLGAKGQISAIC